MWLVFSKPLSPARGASSHCLPDGFFSRRKWVNAHKKQGLVLRKGPVILAVIILHEGIESDQTRCCPVSKKRFSSIVLATIQCFQGMIFRTGVGCLSPKKMSQILGVSSGSHLGCQGCKILDWIWEMVERQEERKLLAEPVPVSG